MTIEVKANKRGEWFAYVSGADLFAGKKYNTAEIDSAISPYAHTNARLDPATGEILRLSIKIPNQKSDLSNIEPALAAYNPAKSEFELGEERKEAAKESEFDTQMIKLFVRALDNTTFRNAVQRKLGINET